MLRTLWRSAWICVLFAGSSCGERAELCHPYMPLAEGGVRVRVQHVCGSQATAWYPVCMTWCLWFLWSHCPSEFALYCMFSCVDNSRITILPAAVSDAETQSTMMTVFDRHSLGWTQRCVPSRLPLCPLLAGLIFYAGWQAGRACTCVYAGMLAKSGCGCFAHTGCRRTCGAWCVGHLQPGDRLRLVYPG